jgi:hypothetical protein
MPYAPHLPYEYEHSPAPLNHAPTSDLLSPEELQALNDRIAANADRWLGQRVQENKVKSDSRKGREPKSTRGRKPRSIDNPFYTFIGCTTEWGRYPVFALDIIEGIARLDWHDRPIGVGGKSMPLSVRNLAVILESLPVVTVATVMELLQLGERHARRYVKAIELTIPRMMACRPKSLRDEMEGIEPEHKPCEWVDDLPPPSPEALAKLHHDLRPLTQYRSEAEYDAEYNAELLGKVFNDNVVALPVRQEHPAKQQALELLAQGVGIRATARELNVSVNSVRSWRDKELMAA